MVLLVIFYGKVLNLLSEQAPLTASYFEYLVDANLLKNQVQTQKLHDAPRQLDYPIQLLLLYKKVSMHLPFLIVYPLIMLSLSFSLS
uniref:Signal peptide protein n=1 Tax=Caenorhabditis tropicalis TaxID=1561998 RepID=A0A1I7T5I1_9PELO